MLFKALNNRVDPETGKRWKPHAGQIAVGENFFVQGKRRGVVICGRKWGKSETAVDLIWRFGNLINNGQIYYFAAEQSAVREIIWAPRRLQDWGPKEYVASEDKTQMRITFTTGTFAKCDGADNFRGKKGFNPDVVILDEAADYPDSFWQAMGPNFAAKDCIVLIISSPPWRLENEPGKPTLFMRMLEVYKRNPLYFYMNRPTHDNEVNLPPGFLAREEKDLCETGQKDIWDREYLAKFTVNTGDRIIATFDKATHVKPHAMIMERISQSPVDWELVTAIDPGSVYAATFMAINQYTKEVLWLDEIYEKEQKNMMVEAFWPAVRAKQIELCGNSEPDKWLNVYDEREKWFSIEATLRFNEKDEMQCQISPTEKQRDDKLDGLSMLRTIFAYGKGLMSDRCRWTTWEFENYRRNSVGDIPKAHDHTIDDTRYSLHAVEYYISSEDRPVDLKIPEFYKRVPSMEEDMSDMFGEAQDDMGNVLDFIGGGM
jgi:hypothetical protein